MERTDTFNQVASLGESWLWHSKASLKCLFFEAVFNPLLVFCLLWGAFDGFFIFMIMKSEGHLPIAAGLFFAVHLLPVWGYLLGIILVVRHHQLMEFLVTDKAVYISGGYWSRTIKTVPFREIKQTEIHQGFFDRLFNVGDVKISLYPTDALPDGLNMLRDRKSKEIFIIDVAEFKRVHDIIKERLEHEAP
ncbi:MAG: PH domain-containing protein [Bacteriovoracaceae bacterium]|nr:PH domain-containing protein [Bacteriovoracaceae bacterium]